MITSLQTENKDDLGNNARKRILEKNSLEKLDIDQCDEHLRSQNSLIDLNNIDFPGRFENFKNDFNYVLEHLSIESKNMEHLNKGTPKELKLNKEQRLRIYNFYEKDFRIFYPAHKATLD